MFFQTLVTEGYRAPHRSAKMLLEISFANIIQTFCAVDLILMTYLCMDGLIHCGI
jgi:hypothetical protein